MIQGLCTQKTMINKGLLTSDSQVDFGYREVKVCTGGKAKVANLEKKNYTVVLTIFQAP